MNSVRHTPSLLQFTFSDCRLVLVLVNYRNGCMYVCMHVCVCMYELIIMLILVNDMYFVLMKFFELE